MLFSPSCISEHERSHRPSLVSKCPAGKKELVLVMDQQLALIEDALRKARLLHCHYSPNRPQTRHTE